MGSNKIVVLILFLLTIFYAESQTILKDKKQELRVERVIQNSEPCYKIYFKATYLVIGNKTLTNLFLEEILNVLHLQNTVYSYVGNTPVKYEYVDDKVIIYTRGSKFSLTKKQILKIKKEII